MKTVEFVLKKNFQVKKKIDEVNRGVCADYFVFLSRNNAFLQYLTASL